jgi:hypothetical protein
MYWGEQEICCTKESGHELPCVFRYFTGSEFVSARAFEEVERARKTYLENLTATQNRCTELIQENRAMKRAARRFVSPGAWDDTVREELAK